MPLAEKYKETIVGDRFVFLFLLIYLGAGFIVIGKFDGTGDAGDSITHFLFARDAFKHPDLFFHHWAKPLYVLLASPFAQFGFNGIKVFNLLLGSGTIFLTYLIAKKLDFKRAQIAPILLAAFPLNFALTFSGLTEPLFAFLSTLSILFLIGEKKVLACVLFSFLPFVRSEGLVIDLAVGAYLAWYSQYRTVPWLLTGSVVYAIAGYPVHHDLFWVYTSIPYATMSSVYGHGSLDHFVIQLYYTIGLPGYVLLVSGLVFICVRYIRRKPDPKSLIIVGTFLAFFIAHSLFWFFGIFNSMGLKRVLLCVLPQAALIGLEGFNGLIGLFNRPAFKHGLVFVLIAGTIVFPFTSNPAAVKPARDLCKEQELTTADSLVEFVKQLDERGGTMVYDHQYFSLVFDKDHFDKTERSPITQGSVNQMKISDLLIWDNSPSRNPSALGKEDLDKTGLIPLKTFYSSEKNITFVLYRRGS